MPELLRRYSLAEVEQAAEQLRRGGVLAYPTEAVFGLGCDPHDPVAFARLFALKRRPPSEGVLLIAARFDQVARYIDVDAVAPATLARIREEWPGPYTWIFPRSPAVPSWIAGRHAGIALRITAHPPAAALCLAFDGALVSTSANPHGASPARTLPQLEAYFGGGLDGVLDGPLGGLTRPTLIRDALSGAVVRS